MTARSSRKERDEDCGVTSASFAAARVRVARAVTCLSVVVVKRDVLSAIDDLVSVAEPEERAAKSTIDRAKGLGEELVIASANDVVVINKLVKGVCGSVNGDLHRCEGGLAPGGWPRKMMIRGPPEVVKPPPGWSIGNI